MTPSTALPAGRRRTLLAASLLIIVIVFSAYGGVIRHGFVWDDQYIVEYDARIRSAEVGRYFTEYYFRGEYYRPMVLAAFALDWALYEKDPAGYHLTNLLIHLAATLALLFLLNRITGAAGAAAAGALLFAVHPIHVENIAFLSARGDMLAALFVFVSMACYIRFRKEGGPPPAYLAASLAGFALALFSKEMAATLPAVLVSYDALILRRFARMRVYAAFLLVFIAYLFLRHSALNGLGSSPGITGENLLLIPGALLAYLRMVFLPGRGEVLHTLPVPGSVLSQEFIVPFVLVLACGVFIAAARQRPVRFGIVFIFVTLLPVSNIIALSPPVAERFAYLPSAGFSMCAAALLAWSAERMGQTVKFGAVLAVVLIAAYFSLVSVRSLHPWKNNVSLWEAAAGSRPESPLALTNLGRSYHDAGRSVEAVPILRKALRLDSTNANAFIALGESYRAAGRPDSASIIWDRLAGRDPRPIHSYLAAAGKLALGDTASAVRGISGAIESGYGAPDAFLDLAEISLVRGDSAAACSIFTAVPGRASLPPRLLERGNRLVEKRSLTAAVFLWRQAIGIDSLFIPAYRNLASASVYLRRPADAERYWRRILAINPRETDIYLHWARLKLAGGQPDSAALLAERGLQVSTDKNTKTRLAELLRQISEH